MSDVEKVARAIARRIAKREYGEQYEGYESTHKEAADDYARAAFHAALAAHRAEVREVLRPFAERLKPSFSRRPSTGKYTLVEVEHLRRAAALHEKMEG